MSSESEDDWVEEGVVPGTESQLIAEFCTDGDDTYMTGRNSDGTVIAYKVNEKADSSKKMTQAECIELRKFMCSVQDLDDSDLQIANELFVMNLGELPEVLKEAPKKVAQKKEAVKKKKEINSDSESDGGGFDKKEKEEKKPLTAKVEEKVEKPKKEAEKKGKKSQGEKQVAQKKTRAPPRKRKREVQPEEKSIPVKNAAKGTLDSFVTSSKVAVGTPGMQWNLTVSGTNFEDFQKIAKMF